MFTSPQALESAARSSNSQRPDSRRRFDAYAFLENATAGERRGLDDSAAMRLLASGEIQFNAYRNHVGAMLSLVWTIEQWLSSRLPTRYPTAWLSRSGWLIADAHALGLDLVLREFDSTHWSHWTSQCGADPTRVWGVLYVLESRLLAGRTLASLNARNPAVLAARRGLSGDPHPFALERQTRFRRWLSVALPDADASVAAACAARLTLRLMREQLDRSTAA